MTPEQLEQIKIYKAIIPTIPEAKIRRKHHKKIRLFIEQDGICCLCDKAMILRHGGSNGPYATFEHVKVKSSDGTNDAANTPLSHGTCNSRRGTKDFAQFRAEIAGNGGTPPKARRTSKYLSNAVRAAQGDEFALEHIIAKRLNLALYVFRVEQGWAEPAIPLAHLYQKLDKPLELRGI